MNAQTTTMERPAVADFAPPAPKTNVVPYLAPGAPKAYPPKIAKALLAITREIGAVGKNGENTFHKYHYQKWEDVLNAISPLMAQHGIIISQSEVARSLFENDQMMSITYAFTIVNEDGDVWPDQPVWTAIARARDQKGIPDDKAANKAHTQAHKYFLLHLFNIRTVEIDDSDSDEPRKPKPPNPNEKQPDAGYVAPNGHTFESWAAAYEAALRGAKDPTEIKRLGEINSGLLERLKAGRPEAHEALMKLAAERSAPAKPKPPRPGTAQTTPKPAATTMPDPTTDAAVWLAWLTEKMKGFDTYEAGEKYWNETIQALDLPPGLQEDAMGAWQRFEDKHAP